jgi:transposase
MLPTAVRIFVCTVPQGMRRSFDALTLVVQQVLGQDPLCGALYMFVGKSSTRVKVLWWDRSGYCLLYKRLHRALLELPRASDGAPCVSASTARRWAKCSLASPPSEKSAHPH